MVNRYSIHCSSCDALYNIPIKKVPTKNTNQPLALFFFEKIALKIHKTIKHSKNKSDFENTIFQFFVNAKIIATMSARRNTTTLKYGLLRKV
jgi:hypothetical protein